VGKKWIPGAAATGFSIALFFLQWYLQETHQMTPATIQWIWYAFIAFVVASIGLWIYWIVNSIWNKNRKSPTISYIYNQISLACHIWKNAYILYYPDRFGKRDGQQYLDVWEKMEKIGNHIYSEQEWLKYRPLFDQVVVEVTNKLLELMKLFPDSIEEQFKMQVYQTIEQLKLERNMYLRTPNLIGLFGDKDQAFNVRFLAVIRCLSSLDREAQKISARNRPKN
jgi:hypothetical protein